MKNNNQLIYENPLQKIIIFLMQKITVDDNSIIKASF